jgi:hypothetical protein
MMRHKRVGKVLLAHLRSICLGKEESSACNQDGSAVEKLEVQNCVVEFSRP